MNGKNSMNNQKNIDYNEMYEAFDMPMDKQLPQMELYCEIGKDVWWRTGKGEAVIESEYLDKQYPNIKDLSPQSLCRMLDFFLTYENHLDLLSRAIQLGWI